jgi:hypothetical protein
MNRQVACVVLAGLASTLQASEPVMVWASVPIHIDAFGEAEIGSVTGVSNVVEKFVADALAKEVFEPAMVAGKPVAMGLEANIEVQLQAVKGGYLPRIGTIRMTPGLKSVQLPPRFPVTMARAGKSGWAEVRLRVGADGRAQTLATSGSDPVFTNEAAAWLRRVRFEMPRNPEGSVPVEFSVPFLFVYGTSRMTAHEFACEPAIGLPRPKSERASGCAATVMVTAQPVR